MTAAFDLLWHRGGQLTATLLRPDTTQSGQRASTLTIIESFPCLELTPVDAQTLIEQGISTPYEVWHTTVESDSLVIEAEDQLSVGGVQYPILRAPRYPIAGMHRYSLYLEKRV